MQNKKLVFFQRTKTAVLLISILFFLSQSKFLWIVLILVSGLYVAKYEFLPLIMGRSEGWLFLYPGIPVILLSCYSLGARSWEEMLYPWIAASVADTSAYLVGNLFGKHQICPTISPKKTIEGFIGGVIGLYLLHYIFYQISGLLNLTISLFVGATSFFGDIFISWFKRRSAIKDAGNFLPGHGGLLDRLDSVYGIICGLFCLRLSYLFWKFF